MIAPFPIRECSLKPSKSHFFCAHRKPFQNCPIIYGGFFFNRQTQTPKPISPFPFPTHVNLQNWVPLHLLSIPKSPTSRTFFPIALYICDFFRKHRSWDSFGISWKTGKPHFIALYLYGVNWNEIACRHKNKATMHPVLCSNEN
ncbi:hypothetical protein AAC387_Pa05g3219 [Persea americana]